MLNFKKNFFLLICLLLSISSVIAAPASDITKKNPINFSDIGTGPVLVLIHPFAVDSRFWNPQQPLTQKFRVITFDLWGFGLSSTTDGKAVTMEKYAMEVKQLLDQLHIEKAIIAGESMGGYVAIAFFKKYPTMVNGLVLSDTSSSADTPQNKTLREKDAVGLIKNGSKYFIENYLPKLLSQSASDQSLMDLKALVNKQQPNGFASAIRGIAQREDTTDVLKRTSLPVLIITGSADAIISPDESKNMHKITKNSQLIILDGAGHFSSFEQPDKWNQAVIDMFGDKTEGKVI